MVRQKVQDQNQSAQILRNENNFQVHCNDEVRFATLKAKTSADPSEKWHLAKTLTLFTVTYENNR